MGRAGQAGAAGGGAIPRTAGACVHPWLRLARGRRAVPAEDDAASRAALVLSCGASERRGVRAPVARCLLAWIFRLVPLLVGTVRCATAVAETSAGDALLASQPLVFPACSDHFQSTIQMLTGHSSDTLYAIYCNFTSRDIMTECIISVPTVANPSKAP